MLLKQPKVSYCIINVTKKAHFKLNISAVNLYIGKHNLKINTELLELYLLLLTTVTTIKILTDQLFSTYLSARVFTVRVYGSDLQGGESAAAVLLTFHSHVCCQCLTVTAVRGTVTHFLGK